MRNAGLLLAVILAASFLVVLPSQAEVYNVNVGSVGDSGVSGTATLIVNAIGGTHPYHNVEIDARLNRMPPQDMVYEGWLVDNETGYKLSTGAFTGQTLDFRQRFVHFEDSMPYDAFVVTLEPKHDANPNPAATHVAQGNLPGDELSASEFQRSAVMAPGEMFQRQVVMRRFNLTSDQVMSLRMQGWSYPEIAMVANAAARCNKQPTEISSMLMRGQGWEEIAESCNTTVAMLMEPVPTEAVAGFRAEVAPGVSPPAGMVQPMVVYQRYPNGRPVVTQQIWEEWSKRGYEWRDVAVAANIASRTGESLDDLLRMVRVRGQTWRTIAIERGLDSDDMLDVSQWPFSRNGEATAMMPAPPAETPAPPATTAPPPSGPSY